MSIEEFIDSYCEAKAELEADEARLHEQVRRRAEAMSRAWEEVFRKVQELEEGEQ